jgi:AbrB family transcriptional regulator (stage V sporulation protein T)
MKETGVVRHLDELGRIVIPKEIRRNLRMNEGDLLEIFVDEGESVVLKKHTPFKVFEEDSFHLTKTLFDFYKNTVLITDNDKVVNGYGYRYGDYIDKQLSRKYQSIIHKEETYFGKVDNIIEAKDEVNKCIVYILKNKEQVYGSIVMIEDQKDINEIMKELLEFISSYFAKKLDI